MASDNVQIFTYIKPLTALSTYVSEKMILGQYISLSAVCYADQTFNFIFEFSGDGSNWDVSNSENVLASTGTQIIATVKAKWTRIRLVSTSGVNQTVLRVYVYATPSNSATTATLTSLNNLNPKVDISADIQRSAFDEILTQIYEPQASFKWDQMVSGALYNASSASRFASPYLQGMDLWVYSGGISTDGVITKGDDTLRLSTNETTLNTDYILASRIIPYSAGIGLEMLFTASFNQPTVRASNQRQLIGLLNVNGALGNGTLYDGFLIGYDDLTVSTTSLEIAWYRGGILQQRIPQSNWNIDPCDGSVKAPNIDPTKINIFKLSVGYLGTAGCLFSIMGTDGRFYPFHKISPNNSISQTQWSISGVRGGMLVRASVTSTSNDGYIENGSMSVGLCGKRQSNSFLISRSNTISASTSEACILAVRNIDGGTLFMGEPNHLCYALEALRLAVTSPNNVITTVNIYKNLATPVGTYISTGNLNNSTQFATNETGYGTGSLVLSYPLSQDGTVELPLDESDEAIRNQYWTLQPGENYCITAITSGSTTTVSASLNWHHV